MLGIIEYVLVGAKKIVRLAHLKDCTCPKNVVDDVVVTCDEIVDIPEATSISSNNGMNYWFLCVILLKILCLLLLLVITVKYEVWINNSILIMLV